MMSDLEMMQLALRLAERGQYTTDPNPRVGCVIVKDNNIVGQGWHQRAGEGHAEVNALALAGDNASGATAYVTLEPCSHTGKTPPCADALIQAGVTRVVVAMTDPNPLVAGKGLEKLACSGISVESGLLEAQARQLNVGFVHRMEHLRPYVRLKMGMSLDARTAMASGESQWITGEAARRDVQFMRARSSAVLTGSGTVLADDPSMNVRLSAEELNIEGEVRQPLRVVLDSQLQTPASAKILKGEGDCWLLRSAQQTNDKPAMADNVIQILDDKDGHVDLSEAMTFLAKQEINLVHVEAGARLSGALLQAQLVDEIVLYVAPVIMGNDARGLFSLPGLSKMKDRLQLSISDVRSIGKDIKITAQPQYS